jgi:hypothetical protein
MSTFRISRQTEAEKDQYLLECFYDAGFIRTLLESNSSILSGRKWAGKTALARFLENNPSEYGVDYAYRLSVRNIEVNKDSERHERVNSILFFVLIQAIQKMLYVKGFSADSEKYWRDFLIQNGLQNVSDYETFVESKKSHSSGFSIKAKIAAWFASSEGSVEQTDSQESSKAIISNAPSSLTSSLCQSLPDDKKFVFFVDDISDHLDSSDSKQMSNDIDVIKEVLLGLENFNTQFSEAKKNLRFVSLIRDDLFEFMMGSNLNKLRSDALKLEWNEKSFACLLIRRLPFFQDDVEKYLADPIESIRSQFPDSIFNKSLEGFETNQFATNFYAYMVAISFNRPRDFLMFCYAMRDRLSLKHPATLENIESAEGEYSDYFNKELRDELFIAGRILAHELTQEELNKLIDLLGQRNGFNSPQLRTELARYLGVKTSIGRKKIEAFIQELWWYGVVGFREDNSKIIHFKYISDRVALTLDKIKHSVFYLHRGLWWFAQRRRAVRSKKNENLS